MTLFGFTAGLFNDGCSHSEFGQCQDSCISPEPHLYAKLKADQLLTSAPDTYEQNGPIQIELNILETRWKTEGKWVGIVAWASDCESNPPCVWSCCHWRCASFRCQFVAQWGRSSQRFGLHVTSCLMMKLASLAPYCTSADSDFWGMVSPVVKHCVEIRKYCKTKKKKGMSFMWHKWSQ